VTRIRAVATAAPRSTDAPQGEDIVQRVLRNAGDNRRRQEAVQAERQRLEDMIGADARRDYLSRGRNDPRAVAAGIVNPDRAEVAQVATRPESARRMADATQRLAPQAEAAIADHAAHAVEVRHADPIIINEDGRQIHLDGSQRIRLRDYLISHPRIFPTFEQYFDAIAGVSGFDLESDEALGAAQNARTVYEQGSGHGREPAAAAYETTEEYRAQRGTPQFEAQYDAQNIDMGIDPETEQQMIVGVRTSPVSLPTVPEPPVAARRPVPTDTSVEERARHDLDGARIRQRAERARQARVDQQMARVTPRPFMVTPRPFMVRIGQRAIANAEASYQFWREREGKPRRAGGARQLALNPKQFVDPQQGVNLDGEGDEIQVNGQPPIDPERVEGTQPRHERILNGLRNDHPGLAAALGVAAVAAGEEIDLGHGASVSTEGVQFRRTW
jgi:hypothetical protein